MKVVAVLKYPNIDIIAEVNDFLLADYEIGEFDQKSFDNVYVVQWIDKHVTMIPFKAAKHLNITIPKENIAMMFEADEKLAQIHEEEKKKSITPFISKDEFDEMVRKNQEKLNKTLCK